MFFKLFYIVSLIINIQALKTNNKLDQPKDICDNSNLIQECDEEKNNLNININLWKEKACKPLIKDDAHECYNLYKTIYPKINCNLFFSKNRGICTVTGDIDKDNCERLRNTEHTRFYLDDTTKSIYLKEY
jgi:hypothetical protein